MRRMIIPAILALGIHGLLFGMEFNWFQGKTFFKPKAPAMTLTLTYLQPQKQSPKPVPQKQAPIEKKSVKTEKKIKSKPKPNIIPLSQLEPKLQSPQPVKKIGPVPVNTQLEPVSDTKPVAFFNRAAKTLTATPAPVIREAKPLYRVNPPPKYPRSAKKRGYQGVVILEVFVNQDGGVNDLKVLQSSGHAVLDKAALASVKKWQFEPARRGREKLEMWVRVPIRFQLK